VAFAAVLLTTLNGLTSHRPTIWGWGSVLDHLGGAVSGDGRPELVRQTGARPHIYNFAPVPSLAPLVPSSSLEVCLQGALVTRSLPSTITSWS